MIKATMDVDDEELGEIEVEISGSYSPAERGNRECGIQMEPDYDAMIEDISATYKGRPYDLSDKDIDKAHDILMEVANDRDE